MAGKHNRQWIHGSTWEFSHLALEKRVKGVKSQKERQKEKRNLKKLNEMSVRPPEFDPANYMMDGIHIPPNFW
eukprot:CAMPEP_0181347810 /NCGR_PEP_ID=MMETSP1101-20121128/34075_1 /TAXON_ID=46948 /ORGANISM="Rhodomonas abbreviata, Strain Caron Lab Isolate" /LENGTH=72 /DNA_ID=CAMNT_0023460045 /DNA_START=435 /DNA_END=650 /DNA_ORIENTATION=+